MFRAFRQERLQCCGWREGMVKVEVEGRRNVLALLLQPNQPQLDQKRDVSTKWGLVVK